MAALVALVLVAVGVGTLTQTGNNVPPRVLILPATNPLTQNPPKLLDRVIPRTAGWGWLWKLRYAVFGTPKTVSLEFEVYEFDGAWDASASSVLKDHSPAASRDGTRVWLLDQNWMGAWMQSLRTESGAVLKETPRIDMGQNCLGALHQGCQVQTSNGLQQAGLTVEAYPRFRGEVVDLSTRILKTDAVTNDAAPNAVVNLRTNLMEALRLQLQNGEWALLLSPEAAGTSNKFIGIVIHATRSDWRRP